MPLKEQRRSSQGHHYIRIETGGKKNLVIRLRAGLLLCYSFINVELWGEWDVEEPLGVLKHLEALLFC